MFYRLRLNILIIAIGFFFTGCETVTIRIAHFNIKEFSLEKITDVDEQGLGRHPQLLAAAAIIQQVKPDILLLQEIDHDYTRGPAGQPDFKGPAKQFIKNYLSKGQDPIGYHYIYSAPCNTGILTGLDLDGDGTVAQNSDAYTSKHGADSYGWGTYPGQYSMVLLSRYPVDTTHVRTFRNFLWTDVPGNHLPVDYYSQEAIKILRLSSKSHWDVPIFIGTNTLHVFISHPTPPVFDGPEDRNGRRNFDEIMFWKLYLNNDRSLYDDRGESGGYTGSDPFVLAGDLNADPDAKIAYDGSNAISQLLNHPLIQDTRNFLTSSGSAEGLKDAQKCYTAEFAKDNRMQIDYLLASKNLKVINGAVFWPSSTDQPVQHKLAETASDHRLIWLDLDLKRTH